MPESGAELAATLFYSALYIVVGVLLPTFSDRLIRFISNVPGDKPETPA